MSSTTGKYDLSLTGATGRMRGYTEELDGVERVVLRTVRDINANIKAKGKAAAPVTFEVTQRTVIEYRGIFTKRAVSKYEFEMEGPKALLLIISQLIDDLIARIS